MKTLRKPQLAFALSVILLLASCSQYEYFDSEELKFNYSLYNEFIDDDYNIGIIYEVNNHLNNMKDLNESDSMSIMLREVNEYYQSDLNFSNDFLISLNHSTDELPEILIDLGYIKNEDLNLIDHFLTDSDIHGFEYALEEFQASVTELSLSTSEFKNKNDFANVLKSLNHFAPSLFSNNKNFSKSGLGCARAALALTAASVALATCVTVVACGIAVTGWILAYGAYQDNCINHHQ
ncbi:hypothetical protein [Psychroflexus tropicus]|uniref:hypothetical protein n=1 Tax=Psychroflexus tropicus TaxID=197345 RepID=UPI00036B7698|nr:hypothetical protein [Psychroflexus tropicus]